MESEKLPSGGLFSPNTDPALAQKFISGRFATGARADAGQSYVERFVFATQFVFSAQDARTPSQNKALRQSLHGFFAAAAKQCLGPKRDKCGQITRVVVLKSDTGFWGPVALNVFRRTTVRDADGAHMNGDFGLGANVYVPELDAFSSAVVSARLGDPRVLFESEPAPHSVAHKTKTPGGVLALVTHTFEQRAISDGAVEKRTCWVVPKRSALALHFQRMAEEMGGTTERRTKWVKERTGGETESDIYMYEERARVMRKSMLEHEVAGIYLEDVLSGVHEFTLEARPVVFPVGGKNVSPGEIAEANPLIAANLIVPPNSDGEILERWTTRYSLDVQIEFEITVYT